MNSTELPQPFAGAITLLEAIATHGSQALFEDGTATPNAKLCERFARELREYARTALASQASKGAGAQPIYQSRSLRGISPGGWFDSANKAEWEKAQDHPAYEHRVVYSAAQAQPVAIARVREILDGIDRDELEPPKGGWWETSVGANFGAKKLAELEAYLIGAQPVADAAPVVAKPFAYFVQPSSFGPFIECKPDQVGSFLAYRALAAKPAETKS